MNTRIGDASVRIQWQAAVWVHLLSHCDTPLACRRCFKWLARSPTHTREFWLAVAARQLLLE